MWRAWVVLAILIAAGRGEAASTSKSVSVSCSRGGAPAGAAAERDLPGPNWGLRRSSVRYPDRWRRHGYPGGCLHEFAFRMEVIPDTPQVGLRSGPQNEPLMLVRPGTTYSVRLTNPLPVRAAVTLTIDGLNTISGAPAGGPAEGAKWMVGPHGTTTISGWQTGSRSARRFVFTSRGSSYAQYRSGHYGQDLAANCGVIGAAFFWNAAELEAALYHPPIVYEHDFMRRMKPGKLAPAAGAASESRAFDAGTGQGERVYNPVHTVQFSYDAGMYDPAGALAIYYDFPGPGDLYPRPFSESSGFAPEMR